MPRSDARDLGERRLGGGGIALGAHSLYPLELAPLRLWIEPVELDLLAFRLRVAVDAHDDALARLDVRVPAKCRLLDLALDVPLLDRCDRAAELVDVLDQLQRALLELVVSASMKKEPPSGSAVSVAPPLVREHLLRPERDPGGVLGRERERLVEAVRMQALGAAAGRRERLDRDPDDVVLGLLRGEGRTAGLGVEAERERLRVRGAEAVAHQRRPQPPRGAELRHLLEEVVVRVEEEGEARAELVRRKARLDGRRAVGDPVRERERELLDGRRAGLADVVAGDRDRVPARDPLPRSRRRDPWSGASRAAAGRCSSRARCTP